MSASSLFGFVLGAAILRALAVAAWGVFPGTGVIPRVGRVLVPLLVTIGLFVLNKRFLSRDGFPPGSIGLEPRRIGWFFAGGVLVVPVILAIAAGLWLIVPFHWERGSMSWSQLGWQAAEYVSGNCGEELMFRGYLLLALIRGLGPQRGLAAVALSFGLFHLPGLSGLALLKMVCSTAAWSYLFAAGYLLTGTIWTAVGLHAFGNLVLHHLLGMSGGATTILTPIVEGAWPTSYDPAFWVGMAVCVPLAAGASILVSGTHHVGQCLWPVAATPVGATMNASGCPSNKTATPP